MALWGKPNEPSIQHQVYIYMQCVHSYHRLGLLGSPAPITLSGKKYALNKMYALNNMYVLNKVVCNQVP